MKKFYLFMLMAVGLLISGNVGAAQIGEPTTNSTPPDGTKAYVKCYLKDNNYHSSYFFYYFDNASDIFTAELNFIGLKWIGKGYNDDGEYVDMEFTSTQGSVSAYYVLDAGDALTIQKMGTATIYVQDATITDLTIASEATVSFSQETTITGNLINNGSLTSSSVLTVNGTLTNNGGATLKAPVSGIGSMSNAGTITLSSTYCIDITSWTTNSGDVTTSTLKSGFIYTLPATNTGNIKITKAGSFSSDPTAYVDPAKFAVVKVSDNQWDVTQYAVRNTTQGKSYMDFETAYGEAVDGDELNLYSAQTVSTVTPMNKNVTFTESTMNIGGNITMTAGTYKQISINSGATLTIPSGTVTTSSKLNVSGTLNMTGGELISSYNVSSYIAIEAQNGGSINITGGTITMQNAVKAAIGTETSGTSSLNVANATINATNATNGIYNCNVANATVSNCTVNAKTALYVYYNKAMSINGGTYSASGTKVLDGYGVYILSGTEKFNKAIDASLIPDFICEYNSESGYYELTARPEIFAIGTTHYRSVGSLRAAMQDGDEVKLLDNVALTETMDINKSITFDLNGFTLSNDNSFTTGDLIKISSNAVVTLKTSREGGSAILNGGDAWISTINLYSGSLSIENGRYELAGAAKYYVINAYGNLTIKEGEFVNNSTYEYASKVISLTSGKTCTILGGTFNKQINALGAVTFNISSGNIPSLWNSTGSSCTYNISGGYIGEIGGNMTNTWNITGGEFGFDPKGKTATGYIATKIDGQERWKVELGEAPANVLVDFLKGEGTSLTLTENYDLSTYPAQFNAVGIKTLDLAGHSVVMPKGLMTVMGDITITNSGAEASFSDKVEVMAPSFEREFDQVIQVAEGGKLTVKGTNKNITIYGNTVGIRVAARGELVLDNTIVKAQYNGAIVSGVGSKLTITNSEVESQSTSKDKYNWSYAIRACGSSLELENTKVTGVQGAVGISDNGGTANIRNCDLQAHHTSGYTDCHAALYVATNAIVNVWDTKMKSERTNYAAFVGNNDNTNEWGIINLYGGCLLSDKMYVQLNKNAESSFPAFIPKNSNWYTLWANAGTGYTGEGPLPSGYDYKASSESGYSWEVVAPAGTDENKTKDDPAETEVWGLISSWSSDKVPEESTIVTISHDIDIKGSGEGATPAAVAEQIFVNPNATLTVEDGVLLTVGEGGMTIAEGGQMVIEPGAVVKVGDGGVINTSDDAIVIKAKEGKSGAFLIGPAVTEATHPYATVEMYTRAREISTVEHRWQHFAIPTIGKPSETPLPQSHPSGNSYLIYIYEWNHTAKQWQTIGTWDKLNEPFRGYDLTNNLPATTYSEKGGVTYVFHGNIIGNGDGNLEFLSKGYNFFGNSYTAPIDIATMFNSLDASIEKTIAIYDVENNQYVYSNEVMINLGFTTTNQIYPLQGFFLNLKDETLTNPTINYKDAVYNNPNLAAGSGGLAAPRQQEAFEANAVAIQVEAEGNADEIVLIAMNDLTADFENGFDATKLMNESNLNLYANTMAGKLGVVATNELVGTTMDFQSNDATQYTMTFSNVKGQVYELIDVMTGIRTRMEEGATYTFNAEANSLVPNRFQVCEAAKAPTSMENVKAAAKGIYTVLGQPVGNNWMSLPAGVYIVNGVRVVK